MSLPRDNTSSSGSSRGEERKAETKDQPTLPIRLIARNPAVVSRLIQEGKDRPHPKIPAKVDSYPGIKAALSHKLRLLQESKLTDPELKELSDSLKTLKLELYHTCRLPTIYTSDEELKPQLTEEEVAKIRKLLNPVKELAVALDAFLQLQDLIDENRSKNNEEPTIAQLLQQSNLDRNLKKTLSIRQRYTG